MLNKLQSAKETVCRYSLQAERMGLCQQLSGNFSLRDKETGLICITPSGVDRSAMSADDIVVMDIDGGIIENINRLRPTSESLMHLAIYRHRPEITAIAHTHSKAATAFAVMNKPIPAIVYELFTLGCKQGYIPVAPYARPGTNDAAEAVIKPLQIADVALMQAHGVVAVATSLKDAVLKAGYVEELAEIYYMTLTVLGKEPATIPVAELNKWEYPPEMAKRLS